MLFTLSPLPYAYDALAPHIDAQTMQIHHTKHHAGYVNNLNKALDEHANILPEPKLTSILKNIQQYSTAVRNNAGGHYNHQLFWDIINPHHKQQPSKQFIQVLAEQFGAFEKFTELFTEKALQCFGSGWTWLYVKEKKLYVSTTPNQDNPIMDNNSAPCIPILGLDVWEHAYYLTYQNRRIEYIHAFWHIVNWKVVEDKYIEAMAISSHNNV